MSATDILKCLLNVDDPDISVRP